MSNSLNISFFLGSCLQKMFSQINPWISLSLLLKHKYFSSQDLNTIGGVVSEVIKFLMLVYENIKTIVV